MVAGRPAVYKVDSRLIRVIPDDPTDARRYSLPEIEHDPARHQAEVVTSVVIFATALDGGASEVWAVARYHDTVSLEGGARLKRRIVRLQTCSLGIGKHWPL